MKKILRITSGLFIATVLFLGVLEAGLRWLGACNLVLYVPDKQAGYRLKPDQDLVIGGISIHINQWGVRDPRPFLPGDERPQNAPIRVLVLGDSVTWGGIRLPQEALFTSLLEKRIPRTEIINAGVNGYSVAQMAALYQGHLEALSPDRVLVCAIARDFERPPVVHLTGKGIAFPVRRPVLALGVAIDLVRVKLARRFPVLALPSPVYANVPAGPAQVEPNADALAALFHSPQFPPGQVVLLPGRDPRDESVYSRITRALDDRKIPWCDLAEIMDREADYFVDAVHLTRRGHQAVAVSLATMLTPFVQGTAKEKQPLKKEKERGPRSQ